MNEKKDIKKEKKEYKRWITKGLIGVGILFLIVSVFFRFNAMIQEGKTNIISESTLMDTINISELSTAEFTYNGIAQVYKDDEKKKVKCNVRYNAVVKAGIDMKEVRFEVDKENKIVKAILPEIIINSKIIDNKTISFIPANSDIELKDAISACEEDALEEASKASELIEVAKENLKVNIGVLLYPVLHHQEYELVWE